MSIARDRLPSADEATWVAIAASVWFLAALVVGAAGLLAVFPPPFPQLVLLLIVAALGAALWRSALLRRWARTVDLRVLVLVHVSRFVGLYFLFLERRGELASEFAVPAGWGDIAVATLALLLVLGVRLDTAPGRVALLVWNVLGLLDILFVVATATRLGLADAYAIRPFLWLPLSLLPTFLVPLVIFTHLVVFWRLAVGGRRATVSA